MANSPYHQCLSAMYGLRRFGIKLGLDTIQALLAGMGNPHRQTPYIHIAGTNGKGSVASMLSTILQRAGYRVGKYTSPHLERFNERICIDDRPIDDAAVVSAYEKAWHVSGLEREPTFFELTTAMALYEFKRQNVDWAIIETGMGGRLDATNIIDSELALITNISLEHRQYLGHTIAAIAGEKGGIIKPGKTVVCGATQKSARTVIDGIAGRRQAPIYWKGRDFRCRKRPNGQFDYFGRHCTWHSLELGLSGDHQVHNAALALAACETLSAEHGMDIPTEAVRKGLKQTRWPGRMEIVSTTPPLVLDGAHNLMAARTLARYLNKRWSDRSITLVVGVLDDKPCDAILKDLIGPCRRVVVTQPQIDRAIPARTLARTAEKYCSQVEVVPDVGQAVAHALATSSKQGVICVAGSLYVVGEAKSELRRASSAADPRPSSDT